MHVPYVRDVWIAFDDSSAHFRQSYPYIATTSCLGIASKSFLDVWIFSSCGSCRILASAGWWLETFANWLIFFRGCGSTTDQASASLGAILLMQDHLVPCWDVRGWFLHRDHVLKTERNIYIYRFIEYLYRIYTSNYQYSAYIAKSIPQNRNIYTTHRWFVGKLSSKFGRAWLQKWWLMVSIDESITKPLQN